MAERRMSAKFRGRCRDCRGQIYVGDQILWQRGVGARHAFSAACARGIVGEQQAADGEREAMERERRHDEAEYQRGHNETRIAQMAGPPGSAAREQAYMELEQRWARDGEDY